MTRAFVDAGWERLRPSMRSVAPLTRAHFTVGGGTPATPIQRVVQEPTPPAPEADHADYAARMAEFQHPGQNPKSKFTGVSYARGRTKEYWNAIKNVPYRTTKSFPFDAEGELAAALFADQQNRETGRPVHNFPREDDLRPRPSSKFYGVGRWQDKWEAKVQPSRSSLSRRDINGKLYYLGKFDDEQDAARAVDEHLASVGRERRNFPEDEVGDPEDLGGDAVSSPQ